MAIGTELATLASYAKAMEAWFHAAHHAASGIGFAGDHAILYGEIYEKADEEFDDLVERAVGLSGDASLADPVTVLWGALGVLAPPRGGPASWPSAVGGPDEIATNAVTVNRVLIEAVKATTERLRAANELTQGTDNMLAQLAENHERIGYKLAQRATVRKGLVAVIGQPFAKSEATAKLNDDELRAIAGARVDQAIRWGLDDSRKICGPGEVCNDSCACGKCCNGKCTGSCGCGCCCPTDAQIADSVVESITSDFGYSGNANLVIGIRLMGGLPSLRGTVLGRIDAVRARVMADKARREVV